MARGRLPADSLSFSPLSYLDPCDSQPCQNGGTCVPEGLDRYHCLCMLGYGADVHCGRCEPVLSPSLLAESCLRGALCATVGVGLFSRRQAKFTLVLILTVSGPVTGSCCSDTVWVW